MSIFQLRLQTRASQCRRQHIRKEQRRQAVQAARPNVISPLTNGNSSATTTAATQQDSYLTSILSGQTLERSKNELPNGKINQKPPSGTKIQKSNDNAMGRVNSIKVPFSTIGLCYVIIT